MGGLWNDNTRSYVLRYSSVAFHNYGPDEIIRDSVDGYLVDHFDTEAFAKKVAEILKQPERRKQMENVQ